MALTGTVAIKQVTIPAGTAVGVLSALVGATAGNYTVLVYDPQSESLNLSLADSATPDRSYGYGACARQPVRDPEHVGRRVPVCAEDLVC